MEAAGERPGAVFESRSEAETMALAARFAATFQPAPARALRVGLSGDLGAGKTTFVRGLLRGLGVARPVRSPTYSLVEHYEIGDLEVLHADLYRLESPEALASLALDELDRAGALWLVEWPEQGGSALPAPDLALSLSVAGPVHLFRAQPLTPEGSAWLQRLPPANDA